VTPLPWSDVLLRVSVAAGLGLLIGIERESRGQLAGMRTHALVAMGAALFAIVGAYGFPEMSRGPNVDPMRVAAQIVSGIGFIGAGAILRDGGSVRGITTAAGLWASAAIGMAAGAGLYVTGVIGGTLLVAVLVGLRALRDRGLIPNAGGPELVTVGYRRGHGTMIHIVRMIEKAGCRLDGLEIRDGPDRRTVHVSLHVRDQRRLRDCLGALEQLPEIEEIGFTA
jgi:putative Mg2+ transporter-C (MgtC) family protein